MTIEEKAVKAWGVTYDPARAIWILKDGTLVNGCMCGYVRDVDHAEIGQFFKRSKYHVPGSNLLYVRKFIRRGNIRMNAEGRAMYFQLQSPPTAAQWRTMGCCFTRARKLGKAVEIERLARNGPPKLYDRESYMDYLARRGLLAA